MSGMYNMLMGVNPVFGLLCGMVGITRENNREFGRLRDAYINEAADRVFVLHRNYGEDGVPFDAAAANLPTFVAKHMDSRDDTYGYYEFAVPPKYRPAAIVIAEKSDTTPCLEKFHKLIADMQAGKDTPEVTRAMQVGKALFDGLKQAMDTGKRVEVGNDMVIKPIVPEAPKEEGEPG